MATYYGDQFTNAYVNKPSTKFSNGDFNGIPLRQYFEYTITSTTPSATDIIKVGRIPAGARVYDAGLKFTDLGSTGTLELSTAASVDAVEAALVSGLLLTVDANTAADFVTMREQQTAGGTLAGHLKRFASEVDVQILVTTAWTVTSGTIKGYVEFIVD